MGFSRFTAPSRSSRTQGDTQRLSVLYVEDEDINWEIAQHELEEEFNLSRAIDAREAFRLISQHPYDVILLDIQLCGSDIDGIQIARLLKDRYPDAPPEYAAGIHAISTPLIFVTGYTARYSREDLLSSGGEDVIAKPVDFARLSHLMSRFVERGVAARH
jgi:CheY-like chemotaxis protein